jgi:hypothetical protein
MSPLRTFVPLALALFTCACQSTSAGGASATEEGAAKDTKEEDERREKEHKLAYAELKLEVARMEAAAGEAAAARALAAATYEAEQAAQALDNLLKEQRPLEIAGSELMLDRNRQNVLEREQELSELEAMYAQEQFADLTKELVLSRGRAALAMARRDLKLAEGRAAQTLKFDLPRRERELAEKVAGTSQALADAKSRSERGVLERKLALLQAEHALEDAKRAVEQKKPESVAAQ